MAPVGSFIALRTPFGRQRTGICWLFELVAMPYVVPRSSIASPSEFSKPNGTDSTAYEPSSLKRMALVPVLGPLVVPTATPKRLTAFTEVRPSAGPANSVAPPWPSNFTGRSVRPSL